MTSEKKFWAITIVFAVLFGYGVYNLFKPDIPPLSFVRGTVREASPGVLVGPYPSGTEVRRLRAMGVTTVISLMDPDSSVESMLVAEGRARAIANNMAYYNFPINVMNMNGAEGLAMVKRAVALAKASGGSKRGKVYVHCYLGRHRVGIFEQEFLRAIAADGGERPQARTDDNKDSGD